jgi:hypothetical protein
MRRDFAAFSDRDVLLNLDERSDLRLIPDAAAVEIHEVGVKNHHVKAQHDAIVNGHG